MSNKIIYYLFSSITFLQFYIPLVIESKKRGYINKFIIRKNVKEYANPYSQTNLQILKNYLVFYNIDIFEGNINEIEGIVFMVDGDIYGPPRNQILNDSLLFKLNKDKTLRISLSENMNFWAVYNYYIDHVNYAIFTNEYIINQIENFDKEKITSVFSEFSNSLSKSFKSSKNLFLGNTKFDNLDSNEHILEKFNLPKFDQSLNENKFCLILYPKIRDNFKEEDMLNIYKYLRLLGYKIIVKTRPKDKKIPESLVGDYLVCSEIYKPDSLELMKISSLCIISSSSANEETIFSKIPCIDLISDLRPWERNQYLLDNKVCVRIENNIWKKITFYDFSEIINNLENKNSSYFDLLIEKYLFTHKNSSEKIFDFLLKENTFNNLYV